MRLSNRQKAMLHSVPASLGIDDAQRRLIQRDVGGFFSAADATCTREGFIAVMAFYEDHSAEKQLPGFTPGYWRGQHDAAGPGDSLRYRIGLEARRLGWNDDQVEAFLAGPHMSAGQCQSLAAAPPYWLGRLLQGLIEIRRRTLDAGRQARADPGGVA